MENMSVWLRRKRHITATMSYGRVFFWGGSGREGGGVTESRMVLDDTHFQMVQWR